MTWVFEEWVRCKEGKEEDTHSLDVTTDVQEGGTRTREESFRERVGYIPHYIDTDEDTSGFACVRPRSLRLGLHY